MVEIGSCGLASESDRTRRHVCVLSLDVVGYSRMMARDDMMAVAALRAARSVIRDEAKRSSGRIFGTAGDSFMLESQTRLRRWGCAVCVQNSVSSHNGGLPELEQIWLRAGVAGGSAIDDDGNLFGDAVNIAARLQEACTSGGVLVAGDVQKSCGEQFAFEARESWSSRTSRCQSRPSQCLTAVLDAGGSRRARSPSQPSGERCAQGAAREVSPREANKPVLLRYRKKCCLLHSENANRRTREDAGRSSAICERRNFPDQFARA